MHSSLLLASRKIMTLEAYLDFEATSDVKHEFHNGSLRTLLDFSTRHNKIGANLTSAIGNIVDEKKFDASVLISQQKIYIERKQQILYPDLTVVFGAFEFADTTKKAAICNPKLLTEIISPSTANYDRSGKFSAYQSLPSFREYVLIEQKEPLVEVRYLADPERNLWQFSFYDNLEDEIELQSIGCKIPMAKIYRRVEFDPSEERPEEELID